MNPFTKYLSRFLRRLSVPHCEDCKYFLPGNSCVKPFKVGGLYYFTPRSDLARRNKDLCGKHGRYFEPKEGA